MKLIQKIIEETPNSTLSALYENEGSAKSPELKLLCFIIEDGHRDIKETGKTRIPAGIYEVVRRKEGRHYRAYSQRFGHEHTFMLKDVPNFKWIMIHIGNTIDDTEGCLLVNERFQRIVPSGDFVGLDSTKAYHKIYDVLTAATNGRGKVTIEIIRKK